MGMRRRASGGVGKQLLVAGHPNGRRQVLIHKIACITTTRGDGTSRMVKAFQIVIQGNDLRRPFLFQHRLAETWNTVGVFDVQVPSPGPEHLVPLLGVFQQEDCGFGIQRMAPCLRGLPIPRVPCQMPAESRRYLALGFQTVYRSLHQISNISVPYLPLALGDPAWEER